LDLNAKNFITLYISVENKKKKESTEDESRKKPKAAPKPTPQAPRVDASKYFTF